MLLMMILGLIWYLGLGDMLLTVTMSFRFFREISKELRDSPPTHRGRLCNNLACCSAKSGIAKSDLLSD